MPPSLPKFSRLLEEEALTTAIFATINVHLAEQGFRLLAAGSALTQNRRLHRMVFSRIAMENVYANPVMYLVLSLN